MDLDRRKIFCTFKQIMCISNRVVEQELREDNGSYVIIMTSQKNLDAEGKTYSKVMIGLLIR